MVKELKFLKGDKARPLIIFIHGMGMDVNIWSNPVNARILGGRYPLQVLLRGMDMDMRTPFVDLADREYSVLTWSQRRPAGPVEASVSELHELVEKYAKHAENGMFFICHSRGGLIARKYLEKKNRLLRGVITLATPHHGTTMAKWAVYASPIASLLSQLLKDSNKGNQTSALMRILGFLNSKGLRELLPDSEFYAKLKDKKQKDIHCLSIGGTNPYLVKIGAFPLSELIAKAIPKIILPEELRNGYGDGMVSAASSIYPHADEHYNFPVTHAEILFDKKVRDLIVKKIEGMCFRDALISKVLT